MNDTRSPSVFHEQCETRNDAYTCTPSVPSVPTTTCQEDMDCWNCHTMGNKICGPGHETTATTVQPTPTTVEHLPITGLDALWLVTLALVLIAFGWATSRVGGR